MSSTKATSPQHHRQGLLRRYMRVASATLLLVFLAVVVRIVAMMVVSMYLHPTTNGSSWGSSVVGVSSPDSGSQYWREYLYFSNMKDAGGTTSNYYYLEALSPAFVEMAGWLTSTVTSTLTRHQHVITTIINSILDFLEIDSYDDNIVNGVVNGGVVAFILLDGVVVTILLSLLSFVLIPLYKYSWLPTTTTGTTTNGVDVSGESGGYDHHTDTIATPAKWTCSRCFHPKTLSGPHLNGKVDVRSDCYTCGVKRLFELSITTSSSATTSSTSGPTTTTDATRDGGGRWVSMVCVGDPLSLPRPFRRASNPSTSTSTTSSSIYIKPQLIAILALHVLNPFQVLSCMNMSLRVLEQVCSLACILLLTIASHRLLSFPTSSYDAVNNLVSSSSTFNNVVVRGCKNVANVLVFVVPTWTGAMSLITLLSTSTAGLEGLRLAVYLIPLLALLQSRTASSTKRGEGGAAAWCWWMFVVMIAVFLAGAVMVVLESATGRVNNTTTPPPSHHPPDTGVLWYLYLLLPNTVADLYPPMYIFPCLVAGILGCVLYQHASCVAYGKVDHSTSSTTIKTPPPTVESHQWWTWYHRRQHESSSQTTAISSKADERDVPGRGVVQLPPWTSPSFYIRTLWITTFIFATLCRSTFLRTDLTFVILLIIVASPEVTYLSLTQPKYGVDSSKSQSVVGVVPPDGVDADRLPITTSLSPLPPPPPSMVSVLAVALSCIILVVSIPVQYSMHTSWLHTQLANPNWFFFVNLAHIGGFALGTIMYVKSTLYLLKV